MSAQSKIETSEAGHGRVISHANSARPLVTEAWKASDSTIKGATELLMLKVTSDQSFLRSALPAIVKAWCHDQIRDYVSEIRLSTWTPPNADPKGNGGRLRLAVSHLLMDFPLPGGKRLGDASPSEVLDGAEMYRKQADDMFHKTRWLMAVATKAGNAHRIADAMTESELRELREIANA